jgi:hypothetical protein
MAKWNEFDGKYASIRFGWGFAWDYGAFEQDDASKGASHARKQGQAARFQIPAQGPAEIFSEAEGHIYRRHHVRRRQRRMGDAPDRAHGRATEERGLALPRPH